MRLKIIDWVRRRMHYMERADNMPAVPRDLPEGIETLELDSYLHINLDAVAPHQCQIGGEWMGTPEEKSIRPIWDKQFLQLHEDFKNVHCAEVKYFQAWYRRFHGPDGEYKQLGVKKAKLMEEVLEAGDVNYQQHHFEDPERYRVDAHEYRAFDLPEGPVVGYIPSSHVEFTWKGGQLYPISQDEEMEKERRRDCSKPIWTPNPATKSRPTPVEDIRYKPTIFKNSTDVCQWLDNHRYFPRFPLPLYDNDIPDCNNIIKQPMSLYRLQTGAYPCNIEFMKDVRLIFENCRLYYEDEYDLVEMVDQLEELLLKALKQSPEFAAALVSLNFDLKTGI